MPNIHGLEVGISWKSSWKSPAVCSTQSAGVGCVGRVGVMGLRRLRFDLRLKALNP